MRDHFSYLVNDDARDFFQKVAVDQAGVRATAPPAQLTKVAAAPASAFEKIAARLERDVEYLQLAGPCGVNAGMMKRADAYIDLLFDAGGLNDEEFGEIFDKVAAAAIETDLRAAYDQICNGLPETYHGVVDDVLIETGREITKLALMEKEAFIGALARGLGTLAVRGGGAAARAGGAAKALARGAGRALSGAAGGAGSTVRAGMRGAGAVARKGAREVGTAVAAPFKAVARGANAMRSEFRAGRRAAMMEAPDRALKKVESARAAASKGGLRGTVAKAGLPGLEKDLQRAEAGRTAVVAKETGGGALAKRPGFGSKGVDPEPTTAKMPKPKAPKTEAAGAAANKADDAARAGSSDAPDAPKAGGKSGGDGDGPTPAAAAAAAPEKSSGGSGGTPTPPGGADGKPPGFMDAWKKATSDGWKALSPGERGALIRGGVNAALVYRVATGKGAITGNEGII